MSLVRDQRWNGNTNYNLSIFMICVHMLPINFNTEVISLQLGKLIKQKLFLAYSCWVNKLYWNEG
jgi:hypothetical protein